MSVNNATLINLKFNQLSQIATFHHRGVILLMWYNITVTSCTKSKGSFILKSYMYVCVLYREVTALKLSPDGNTVFSISQGS